MSRERKRVVKSEMEKESATEPRAIDRERAVRLRINCIFIAYHRIETEALPCESFKAGSAI